MTESRLFSLVLVPLLAVLSGCSGGSAPQLATDSVLLDFGEVGLGGSAEATLSVDNEGGAVAEIGMPVISGQDGASFSLVNTDWPITLEPGDGVDVVLVFAPAASGVATAEIEVSAALSGGLSGGVDASVTGNLSVAVALLGQGQSQSTGDDDDSAVGDDDDTTGGDDDDTSVGDDDDTSVGDDDDTSVGDDDDDSEAGEDADGDGFADQADGGTDCDDSDPTVNPSSYEICDGVDNDCDGDVDDAPIDGLTWHLDSDSDGYGGQFLSEEACSAPTGYVDNTDDCDDLVAAVYPGATELCNGIDDDCDGDIDEDAPAAQTWYLDNDGDGVGGFWLTQEACSMPQGYAGDSSDCDDTNAAIYPQAPELCDGLDNDCDDSLGSDEVDDDGDGVTECSQDCDDADPLRFPGSAELCDGIDNDCDATTTAAGGELDADSDTSLSCLDCDDDPVTGPAVYPGAAEVCDDVDNDCDGTVDVGAADETTWYFDADGDTYGGFLLTQQACTAPTGYVASSDDCAELDPNSYPGAPEICDGVDNDCNTFVDDGTGATGTVWYADSDADGYGDQGTMSTACSQPIGYVSNDLDCDDGDAATNPTSYEICDGVDNNCADGIDEAGAIDAVDWYADVDEDGFGVVGVSISACDQPTGYANNFADCDDDPTSGATNFPGNTEACDGDDNDCDSNIDEDFDQDGDGAFDEDDAGCASTYAASVLDCDDGDDDTLPGATEVCGDGADQDCDGSDEICFNTVVFNNCTATGRSGPSQTQCNAAYAGTDLFGAVTVSGGIQQWIVPKTDVFSIEVLGARGGGTASGAGLGARMTGDFSLNQGDVLDILVGQQGGDNISSPHCDHSGGGGTFVVLGGNALIVAAGGGGDGHNGDGDDGVTGQNGTTTCNSNNAGSGGNGGGNCTDDSSGGAGGGGFSTDGANSNWSGGTVKGGSSFLNGGIGGAAYANAGEGGFGGGAAGHGNCHIGGGAGGGYSGGGGAHSDLGGGGGGSINTGTSQGNVGGVNSGHGQVTISLVN